MNNTQYYTSGSGRIDSVIRQSSVPPSADCRVNNEHQGYSLSSYQYSCLNDLDYSISVGDKCTNQCQGKSNSKQMLDLYLPQSADPSTVPIVVFVHGGGWRRGDRRAYRHYFSKYDVNLLIAMIMATWGIYQNVGKAFARSGIACAVVSYRLSQLKFPYLILEKLTSFLMTTAIICGPILACSWFTVRYLLAVNSLALTFSDCLWVLCTTAPALFIIYCFYITIYLPSKRIVLLLPLSIIILQLINSTSPFKAYLYYKILYAIITAVTLSLIQGFSRHDDSMDHFNDQTNEVRHPVHVNDVARSIQWLIQYGQKTKLYNPQSLYLCGHSAGGHIVSLLVLDPSYLNNVGVQSSDIKVTLKYTYVLLSVYIYAYISTYYYYISIYEHVTYI